MRHTLHTFLSLDGVMQGPGGPGEDRSGGFERGGWVVPTRLKERPGGELQVHGSCAPAHTLHDAGLLDEYRLIVFPVVLGGGKRLFPDGSVPGTLDLIRSTVTSKGAVALTLQPAGAVGLGHIDIVDGTEVIRPA